MAQAYTKLDGFLKLQCTHHISLQLEAPSGKCFTNCNKNPAPGFSHWKAVVDCRGNPCDLPLAVSANIYNNRLREDTRFEYQSYRREIMSNWVPSAGPPLLIDAMLPHSLHEPQLSAAHAAFLEKALEKRRDDARSFGARVAPTTNATGFRTAGLSIVTAPAASAAPNPATPAHLSSTAPPGVNDEYAHHHPQNPNSHLDHDQDQMPEQQGGRFWDAVSAQGEPEMNYHSPSGNVYGYANPSHAAIQNSTQGYAHSYAHEIPSAVDGMAGVRPIDVGRHGISSNSAIHRDVDEEVDDDIDVSDGEENADDDIEEEDDDVDDDEDIDIDDEDDEDDEEDDEDEDDDANLTEYL